MAAPALPVPEDTIQPLEAVRESTARVMAAARHVRIDDGALQALARELLPRLLPSGSSGAEGGEGVAWDAEGWHYNADAAADGPLTAQYVLVLDALNWCFWPTPGEVCCMWFVCAFKRANRLLIRGHRSIIDDIYII